MNDAFFKKTWLGYYCEIIENIEQRDRRKRSLKIVKKHSNVFTFPHHCNTFMKFRHFIDCYLCQYPKFPNSELVFKVRKQWSLIPQNAFPIYNSTFSDILRFNNEVV